MSVFFIVSCVFSICKGNNIFLKEKTLILLDEENGDIYTVYKIINLLKINALYAKVRKLASSSIVIFGKLYVTLPL